MKKEKWMLGAAAVLISGILTASVFAAEEEEMAAAEKKAPPKELIIADFDTGDKPNNLGGDFGSWNKDPNDSTQSCNMSFVEDDAMGDEFGYALRLDYDVDSPNAAYNGLWMALSALNASAYTHLTFYIKGDTRLGFTKSIKVELKDRALRQASHISAGITENWQKVSIPLKKFRRIEDWTGLMELVLVFDDINSNPKFGAIYLDHITLYNAE